MRPSVSEPGFETRMISPGSRPCQSKSLVPELELDDAATGTGANASASIIVTSDIARSLDKPDRILF